MNCNDVQNLLLQYDDSPDDDSADAPDGVFARVSEHVAGCATCGEMVRKLRRLSSAVRSLPEPTDLRAAQLRFAPQYAAKLAATRSRPRFLTRFVTVLRHPLAAAAAVLLVVGGGTFAYLVNRSHHLATTNPQVAQTPPATTEPSDAFEQAIAWNLSLSETESPEQRQQIYARAADDLQHQLAQLGLSSDDQQAFASLMQGGKQLATAPRPDPLAEADHFTGVADLLVNRMDRVGRKNPKAMRHLQQAYLDVVNKGVRRNLDLAAGDGAATAPTFADPKSPEFQKRMERIIQRTLQTQARLQAMLRDNPDQAEANRLRKQLDAVERRLTKLQQQQRGEIPAPALPLKQNQIH